MKSSAEQVIPQSELSRKYGPQPPRRNEHPPYPKVVYKPRVGSVPLVDDTQTVADVTAEKAAVKDGWKLIPSPVPVDAPYQPLTAEEQRVLVHLIERLTPKKR